MKANSRTRVCSKRGGATANLKKKKTHELIAQVPYDYFIHYLLPQHRAIVIKDSAWRLIPIIIHASVNIGC